MKTLLLIDAHAMIHRAFHALPLTLMTRSGIPTNAVYGFFLMLEKIISETNPTHIAVCFDTPKPTFRKKLFKEYQANRPPMDEGIKEQIPIIKDLLKDGGLACFEKPGFEADDVIGTIAEEQKKDFDRVLILTGDRDLLQLTDEKVFLMAPRKGVTDFQLFTPIEVMEKYGVTPDHIPDYKALAGDSSDNYNTVKGIGPKTTQTLLAGNITIEELLANLDKVENPRFQKLLTEHADDVRLFKKIATIVCDVPLEPYGDTLTFSGFDEAMQKQLKKLELFSLINKLFNTKPEPKKKVEKKKPKPSDQLGLF
jgi:DNA polymerase-1